MSIYKDLGGIELLSWIGLSFSVVNAAMIPLARLITKLYDLKALCVAFEVIMMGGAALAGAAPSIECIIVGRALMAIGCSVLYQM